MKITAEQIKKAALWLNDKFPGVTAYEGHPLWVIGKVLDEAANSGWQSIKTAPKDGTEVLALYLYEGKVFRRVVRYHDGSFRDPDEGWDYLSAVDFKYWRPLPEPPKAEVKK